MSFTSSSQFKTQICRNGIVTMIAATRSLLFTFCCFFQKKGGESKQQQPTWKFINKVTTGGSNVGTPLNCFKDDCAFRPHQYCVNEAILEYVIMTKIKTCSDMS
jgi:hypothetical protein